MSDFILTATAELPTSDRVRNAIKRIRFLAGVVSEAWSNRPRFQTYHEMIAPYGHEADGTRTSARKLPFSDLPPVMMPGRF